MLNFLKKFVFLIKKPQLIIVAGKERFLTGEALFEVLSSHFKVEKVQKINLRNIFKNKILILISDLKEDLSFFVKNLEKPIFVVSHVGEIPPDFDYFSGERKEVREVLKLAKEFPAQGFLVLNFDDETVREIGDKSSSFVLTFGFQEEANFRASDIKLNTGTNFKLNYQGNLVPVWLENIFGKENIYAALAGAACGIQFDLNLVEISQALKNFKGLPGKMRLIEGIKNTKILDDSESATPSSMLRALKIFKEIKTDGRKIAVLGDILEIDGYVVDVHEAIGEKVAKIANLLFTVGPRAKFFAQGAKIKGLEKEKIFSFDTIEETINSLKKEIKKGDLILIDGSKEMEMGKVVEGISVTK